MYVTRQNRVQRPPREMTGMGEAQFSSAVTRMVVPRGVSLNVTREARICRLWTLAGRCLASVSRGGCETRDCEAVVAVRGKVAPI